MSESSDARAREFLAIADQFQLGVLVTESSHPVTANLSEVAKRSTAEALGLLFQVDRDVLDGYRRFVESGRALGLSERVARSVAGGGKVFFTGCGSTGRLSILLDAMWRSFWQSAGRSDYEDRTFSVMAGGDFALIKAVEGFEDFTQFGRRQIADLGVGPGDMAFAITEGGETSFVIGTAWQALEAGADTVFVYNNPDEVLCAHVRRSREVIEEPRIEKLNLTTGPMAISGSTRMQATTIQLAVLSTVLEMAVRRLLGKPFEGVPQRFLAGLERVLDTLSSEDVRGPLAELVEMEEGIYRAGGRVNYLADCLGIDVLTDTTERSPTFCTPPYRRYDDLQAAESWSFLYVPEPHSPQAWRHILQREPRCVAWSDDDIRAMLPPDKAERTIAIVRRIGVDDLMRFRIGIDGLPDRPYRPGDGAVGIFGALDRGDFQTSQLSLAKIKGAKVAGIAVGDVDPPTEPLMVHVPVPDADLLLHGLARCAAKMALNAMSTCTMVRLGRVMGNTMVWVVPSNLKLIDRSTRYIARLTGLGYEEACRLLFEVIEYIEPRMKADQKYPPAVGLAVYRHRFGLSNEEAEERLRADIGGF